MNHLTCPARGQLASFTCGQLAEELALKIGHHLDECETCRAVMETISAAGDTMADSLRRPNPHDEFADESGLQIVAARIQAIGREPSFTSRQSAANAVGADLGVLGQYKLLAKLGEGGMGAVYKALHAKLKKVVALKVLPPGRLSDSHAIDRFHREMEAVGKLDHPNIVRATDAGEVDGTHFLVMELIDGLDLSALVRHTGRLSVADACELIRQAAVGLQHAARRGLVHRDIKPSNLMLTETEDGDALVKILDMGLALLDEQAAAHERNLTSTGQMMGTLDYMAPEQASDSHLVDIRADIYSLGATLFRLLAGEPPFPSSKYNTPIKFLTALATESAPSIATKRNDLPAELVEIVDRMLAKRPEDRFAAPADVTETLAPLTKGANLSALLKAATGDISESPSVDQTKLPTDDFLNRPSTGTQPTLDPSAPTLEKQSPPQASDRRGAGVERSEPPAKSTATKKPGELRSTPATQAQASRSRPRILAIAAALGGIVLLGVVILLVQTKEGTIVVEIDDPDGLIEAAVVGEDIVITDKENNGEPIKLRPGDHKLHVTRGDLEFETDNFVLKNGEKITVRVELRPGQVRVTTADGVQLGSRQIVPPTVAQGESPTNT